MEKNNEEVEVEEPLDLPAEPAEGQEDSTDWKAEAQKLQSKAIAQRERTKANKQRIAELEKAVGTVAATKQTPSHPKTGELDETQLDYLDLKGISESDDVKLIERHIKNTGDTVRQALKDDYVLTKLAANKTAREAKEGTPSSTKRPGGGGGNDLATALAKYEQSGMNPDSLPSDFALRSAVINTMTDRTNPNKPAWHN